MDSWKLDRLYKHVSNTDVAFQLIHEDTETNELTVRWFNIVRFRDPRSMGIIQDIFIRIEDRNKWQELQHPGARLDD